MPQQKLFPYDVKYKTSNLAPRAVIANNGSFNMDFSFDFDVATLEASNSAATDEAVGIIIQPESVTPNAVEAVLNMQPYHVHVNNKFTNTGELTIIQKNHLRDVDFFIDDMGNLVVSAEDAKNYTINNMGELIYTKR